MEPSTTLHRCTPGYFVLFRIIEAHPTVGTGKASFVISVIVVNKFLRRAFVFSVKLCCPSYGPDDIDWFYRFQKAGIASWMDYFNQSQRWADNTRSDHLVSRRVPGWGGASNMWWNRQARVEKVIWRGPEIVALCLRSPGRDRVVLLRSGRKGRGETP